MNNTEGRRRVLYCVACATPTVFHIASLVEKARARGWDVCLILTPTAASWLEADLLPLEQLTGHPVRHTYKRPGQPDVLPPPDALLVAPVSSNTINKWAAGISDTLALGLITEAIGKCLRIVAMPSLNSAQAAHPAFTVSVDTLRGAGVTVLLNDEGHQLRGHPDHQADYPWHLGLDALGDIALR